MTHSIRIAVLNADTPGPNTLAARGSYGTIFHQLFSATAAKISPSLQIEFTDYDAQAGEFPTSLSNVDVVLVTGSAASANDNDVWIRELDAYIREVYTNHPRVKIFAACFGHQLVCKSLLGNFGVRVDQHPHGWELGVQSTTLLEDFRTQIGSSSRFPVAGAVKAMPETLRMQYIHSDFVDILSIGLPRPWVNVGCTDFCGVQGVYHPGRVLTLQGHFEYDRHINREEFMMFGASWESEKLETALAAIDSDDDAEVVAEMVVRFMMEKGPQDE